MVILCGDGPTTTTNDQPWTVNPDWIHSDAEEAEAKRHIALIERAGQAAARMMCAPRSYFVRSKGKKAREFDPRFLVFEYVFDILLRPRQVEMVNTFASNTANDKSTVQQMIMGAGKTTVVGPLLTLLLAETLVWSFQLFHQPFCRFYDQGKKYIHRVQGSLFHNRSM